MRGDYHELVKQSRSLQRPCANEWRINSNRLFSALLLYVLTGCAPEPVCMFLAAYAKSRGLPMKGVGEIVRIVEHAYLSVDMQRLAR